MPQRTYSLGTKMDSMEPGGLSSPRASVLSLLIKAMDSLGQQGADRRGWMDLPGGWLDFPG